MSVKKLVDVLTMQLLLLEKLQIVMGQETDALSVVDLDKMSDLNQQKEELSSEIESSAATMRQAISEQAVKCRLSPAAALGAVAAASDSPEILLLHKSLNLTAERVRSSALVNRDIAERFAETAGSTLNILTGLINQASVYGASGSYQQRLSGSVMINREA